MNLIEGIQKQCKRCRELKKEYDKIPAGAFGSFWIQTTIDEGESAIASGNVVQMLSAFKELESCE